MKRVKSKANPSSSTRNIATQTTDFDSSTEIAKLQDQIKLLQLQNDVLKQQTKTPEKSYTMTRTNKQLYASETPKSKDVKHCKCKKNCSSQACGCVKKNNKCNSLCKCNFEICQNQKSKHDDNKENINNITDVEISMNQNTKSDPIEVMFDPMKPKHQLSRTPPKKNFGEISDIADESLMDNNKTLEPIINNNKSLEMDNAIETQSHYKLNKDTTIVSSVKDVEEENVDWQEHTAQLIPCKKCKRTFMPSRIQKHEACCKKI
ncbi:chromosome-associated kinesin KIF4-like [Nylanderia fulva]|uniref:chromosome-associated kinesin KIF4-like n=1 Tax=Nylanderia fulva TaxID=613905 RepID=UPI0010FB71E8|nr:chromosome-associated kinesin KIF4-like [Nylanderia fulva]